MKQLLPLLILLSFSGCGIVGRIKTIGLIHGTQIEQRHFFEEISFKEENGKLLVSGVYKSTLDQEKGLEYKDQILMINQRDLRQPTQSDYCDLRLNGKNGQDDAAFIWVKVLRNGVELDFKVERFDVEEFFNKNK